MWRHAAKGTLRVLQCRGLQSPHLNTACRGYQALARQRLLPVAPGAACGRRRRLCTHANAAPEIGTSSQGLRGDCFLANIPAGQSLSVVCHCCMRHNGNLHLANAGNAGEAAAPAEAEGPEVAKLDIRVGRIVNIQPHLDAERCLAVFSNLKLLLACATAANCACIAVQELLFALLNVCLCTQPLCGAG